MYQGIFCKKAHLDYILNSNIKTVKPVGMDLFNSHGSGLDVSSQWYFLKIVSSKMESCLDLETLFPLLSRFRGNFLQNYLGLDKVFSR